MDVLYQQAIDKLKKGDISGVNDLEELGNSNHILSIEYLIKLYSEGRLYNQDKKIYWVTKYADLGNFESQKYIGEYYAHSHFNIELAIKYLNMAINTNNDYIEAYYFLSRVYSDGNSDVYDLELAEEYNNLAKEYNSYYEKISNKVVQVKLTKEELLLKGFTLRDDEYLTIHTSEVEVLVDPNNVIHVYDGYTTTTIVAYILIHLKDLFDFTEIELKSYNEIPNIELYVKYLNKNLFNKLKQQGYYFIHRSGDAFIEDNRIMISKTKITSGEQNSEGFYLYTGVIGYADYSGNVIIEPQYELASNYFKGVAVVVKDNKYGVVDEEGNYILPLEFDMLEYDIHYKPLNNVNEYTYLSYKDGLCNLYNESFEMLYQFKSDPENPDYYMEYKDNVLKLQYFDSKKVTLTNLITKEVKEYDLDFEEFGIITSKYLYIKSNNILYIADYELNIVVEQGFTYISDCFTMHDGAWYLACEIDGEKIYLNENMEMCEVEIEEE
jgi:TPR repeat protein